MAEEELMKKVLSCIDEDRVVALASKLMSIPSWDLKGQEDVAKYCAAYMEGMDMEVQLQDVMVMKGMSTKQTIGLFTGSEHKPSLMFCSHLDTGIPYKFDSWTKPLGLVKDCWIYGVGGQKCGMAAMLEAARAVSQTVKLKGDLIVACVAEENTGGIGTQHLLKSGLNPNVAVVGEDTDLELTTVSVAGIFGTIRISGRPDKPRGVGVNPLEKTLKLFQELKPFQSTPRKGWLTFQPHPDLPGYPRFNIVSIQLDPPQRPTSCTILFDCRIVPSQSEETVKRDLKLFLKDLKIRDPDLIVEVKMPAPGFFDRQPFEVSPEVGIVKTVAKWHEYVVGAKPHIGSGVRLGFASDANNLMAAGVECVNYGPGDFQEPINEKKKAEDVVKAAKVYALTATEICG